MEESMFVSMKAAVGFIDISEHYSSQEDLICKYSFNDYTPQEGDRVAIFKLGWTLVKEYLLFEWAPTDSNAKVHHVVFNKHILPKNTSELYQICYISGENELYGASTPFQFTTVSLQKTPKPYDILMKSSMLDSRSSNCSDKIDQSSLKELENLREENSVLKAAIKALTTPKDEADTGGGKSYDKDIEELREITDSLKTAMTQQQREMNALKTKIKECGEEYQKLYLEKIKLERKLQKERVEKSKEIIVNKDVNCFRSISGENNFDISNLPSMPPFPMHK